MRAGHRASVTRIIAQVQQALESEELNSSKLKQQLQTLREKVDVLRKLDSDILSALETEEDITGDIEQADIVKETLESTIFDLEAALTTQEQNNSPTVQPTLRNPAPEQLLSSSRKVDSLRAQSTVAPQTQDNEAAGSSTPVVPERSNTESARAHGCKVRLPKLTLKKFGGDITLWSSFWDSFESSIHNNPDLTDIDKFNYLHSLLEHNAAEAIAGLTLSSSNYEEAIALLKKRFGCKQQLISTHGSSS